MARLSREIIDLFVQALSPDRELSEKIGRELPPIPGLRKGLLVRVVKGRAVPKGTEGRLFWWGYGDYMDKKGDFPLRVGLKTSDGKVWYTNIKNIVAVAGSKS